MAIVNANMNFRISYYMHTYDLQTIFKMTSLKIRMVANLTLPYECRNSNKTYSVDCQGNYTNNNPWTTCTI